MGACWWTEARQEGAGPGPQGQRLPRDGGGGFAAAGAWSRSVSVLSHALPAAVARCTARAARPLRFEDAGVYLSS
jgi:hypothetical protein